LLWTLSLSGAAPPPKAEARPGRITQGALHVLGKDGQPAGVCPLKHTDVKAEISGFVARVWVTQQFENPYKDKIEAVYTFPLPQNAAVDDMTMTVGTRTIKGKILPRDQARAVYEAARAAGHVAGLLDQERPNIFTQSVANIMPGEQVTVTLSYVELLPYEEGSYEFMFPMVVGPRYIPGAATGKQGGGWAPDTDQVPDASRITPPVTPEGTRAGHDISIEVALDAGLPIQSLDSGSHEIVAVNAGPAARRVRLKNEAVIPNKDFILRYQVAGQQLADALLTHHGERGGYFTLILQPPARVAAEDVTPKELVFVLDTSGSMSGFPIEKAKETMALALGSLYPQDTFNLITFAGDTHVLFPQPVPATKANLAAAQEFLATRKGGGGTEMMKAIRAALDPSDSQKHVRIVCFMTDGYVGNDLEIIAEVQRHPNARVFSFGIGSSVNRFLLDKMAAEGRGEVEYVALNDDGSAAARRFHERIRAPLLTDISIDFGGLPVTDVYPKRIPDVFSAKPVVVTGRYGGPARGTIRLRGRAAGQAFAREILVDLPASQPQHDALASLWARKKIDDLMAQDFQGLQYGNVAKELEQAITQLGLEYRLMTQFTSFVAVEELVVTVGGEPRRIDVPVEMPEGVSYEGVFGEGYGRFASTNGAKSSAVGAGAGGGIAGGMLRSTAPPAAPMSRARGQVVAREEMAADVAARQLSPEEYKQLQTRSKLHPEVAAVYDKLVAEKNPRLEATFIRDGKASLQVFLRDTSPETLAKLKELGFELLVEATTGNVLLGRLPVANLAKLAELEAVRYLSPQAF
jgi:Ca-activated chloride channel family protein